MSVSGNNVLTCSMCRAYAIGGDDLCPVPVEYSGRSGRDWSQPADGEVEDYQVDDHFGRQRLSSGSLRQLRTSVTTTADGAI